MSSKRTFTIFATLKEYAHEGWVCLHDPSLQSREIVKITNPENGKSVFCEALASSTLIRNSVD